MGNEWHQAWWVEGAICLDSWQQWQQNGEQPNTPQHGDREQNDVVAVVGESTVDVGMVIGTWLNLRRTWNRPV